MQVSRLVRATADAARGLTAGGTDARPDGVTFHCVYGDGRRVAVRNSLQSVSTFSEEHLMDQVSKEIVQALSENRRSESRPPLP
jgi:hypothetical protein